ncbi:hypothetical protein N9567_04095 [Planktomarina temperata]|nr:hypothetical protein [Planktomarina temperata]MDA8839996.1 hypothetical protein [bacterium]MDG2462843.1 hypothetical protein [Planktomarina sp.]MDA7455136.1 hypothetical protein [Planktomarina temperata]MDA7458519.1 hypothetical protein [Planktomarina temperata]
MTQVAPCRFTAKSVPATGWFGVANGTWAWAGAPPQNCGTDFIRP